MTKPDTGGRGEGWDISEAHLKVMRHALGYPRKDTDYKRNYFCAGDGHASLPLIRELCAAGYMTAFSSINQGRDILYKVTTAGRAALQAQGDER